MHIFYKLFNPSYLSPVHYQVYVQNGGISQISGNTELTEAWQPFLFFSVSNIRIKFIFVFIDVIY